MNSENEETVNQADERVYVKICDCGEVNPASAILCQSCGEDLAYIFPVLQETQPKHQDNSEKNIHTIADNIVKQPNKPNKTHCSFRLRSCNGRFSFEIKDSICILGREHFMKEYLGECAFVSRSHAEILKLSEGEWIVKDLGSTNGTFVNGVRVNEISGMHLNDGDILSLGGIVYKGKQDLRAGYFEIKITTKS